MENSNIWLIDHKATLADDSPLNMDGSEWIWGVCVVPAKSEAEALTGFTDYLAKNGMAEPEVYHVEQYRPENYKDDSKRTRFIDHGVRIASERGVISYSYARTLESLAEEGGGDE